MNQIQVLDHGYTRLVSYMQPAEVNLGPDTKEPPEWNGDLEVVRNARVSYNAEWRTGDDKGRDTKLINYLVKNHHTSPLEAMTFTFEIKAPIFVVRQWHRHRTWSYSEVSARYAELPEQYYVPDLELITTQSEDNKQMRTTVQHPDAVLIQAAINSSCASAFALYKKMLKMGTPRELARGVLPMNTYTHMFATVDLHNLMHFLSLRLHSHAQYEIRVYAEALLRLVEPIVPECMAAFRAHRLNP